ncbi:hypothetical protein ANOM_008419 [Aspergillus nomiae NRRL 13137]|uniref:Uncharacterized protein n=1 Tax=Aspergillus nomiae NRRL (strain ATCC 15546 / NRRL 13137 / CBS 260.88 / M93) TaxID=1509407 RepID=A0A0L1IY65_ASPN3|nr:uncharacterized protein ANOM_008419 [Aspergillus nomiae NRRL 13137]KNG84491.1 hypothetical protein ANOM_008419 [Aspergillus nomiae NRRL 13137]
MDERNNQFKAVNPGKSTQDLIDVLLFVICNDLNATRLTSIGISHLRTLSSLFDTFPAITPSKSVDVKLPPRSFSMCKRSATPLWPEAPSESLTRRALKRPKQEGEPPASNPLTAHPPISTMDEHNLKRFARYGGPDLTDIRGYCSPTNTKSESVYGTTGSQDQGDPEPIYRPDGQCSYVGTTNL